MSRTNYFSDYCFNMEPSINLEKNINEGSKYSMFSEKKVLR